MILLYTRLVKINEETCHPTYCYRFLQFMCTSKLSLHAYILYLILEPVHAAGVPRSKIILLHPNQVKNPPWLCYLFAQAQAAYKRQLEFSSLCTGYRIPQQAVMKPPGASTQWRTCRTGLQNFLMKYSNPSSCVRSWSSFSNFVNACVRAQLNLSLGLYNLSTMLHDQSQLLLQLCGVKFCHQDG